MVRPRKKDTHLPPCVYHRHDGYYLVKKGKWTLLGKNLQSALAEYARRFDGPDGAMAKLIDDAMSYILAGVKPNTQAQYIVAGRKLKHMLADFSPVQVRGKHIMRVQRLLSGTPNMANRCLTVLRKTFDYAVAEELLDDNPAIGIPRLPEKQRDRLLSPTEFQAIYEKGSPRLQCMMDIWLRSGQRVMDVVNIGLKDLTEDGIYFKQEKTGNRLLVKWTPELKAAVERARALPGAVRSYSLFHTQRGKRRGSAPSYGTVGDQWTAACKAAGIEDAQLRDLRAMAGTAAKAQGKNPTILLGHTDPSMTRRYLRSKEVPEADAPSFGQSNTAGKKG